MKRTIIIPEWLVRKGFALHYDMPFTLDEIEEQVTRKTKELKEYQRVYAVARKKMVGKDLKVIKETLGRHIRYLRNDIKMKKDDIKDFEIVYFATEDVEKALRELKNAAKKC